MLRPPPPSPTFYTNAGIFVIALMSTARVTNDFDSVADLGHLLTQMRAAMLGPSASSLTLGTSSEAVAQLDALLAAYYGCIVKYGQYKSDARVSNISFRGEHGDKPSCVLDSRQGGCSKGVH